MTTADEYLNSLRQDDMALGLVAFRTLTAKYRFCLARLPQFNQEISALLVPQQGIDYVALAEAFEPSLVQANEFLMALDVVSVDYPGQTDLTSYGQSLAKIMTSQTTRALADKFAQKCKDWALSADKAKAEDRTRDALQRLGYHDHGNGTVTDLKTRLMWKQCTEGQSGLECLGTALTYNWDTAMKIPKNLNLRGGFAGHTDWRLPTKDELETLIFHGNHPSICLDAFPNAPSVAFWSSSENGASLAWSVYFSDGSVDSYLRNSSYAVRLVRASQ